MEFDNEMTVRMSSKSQNEAFARVAVASFISSLDPTVEEITEVKTAVSEAVTNAIIHGYDKSPGFVSVHCKIKNRCIYIEITDSGKGIEDIGKAREPLYTSRPELERSGLGFTVMETFMDTVEVLSEAGKGTKVVMTKRLTNS